MNRFTVGVRVRPLLPREVEEGEHSVVEHSPQEVSVNVAAVEGFVSRRSFDFDFCLGPESSQEEVFSRIGQSVVACALEGFNCCLFAYGQTGAGKSHSMIGPSHNPGLIPRICDALMSASSRDNVVHVALAVLEVYQEKCRDLLRPRGNVQAVKVREHPKSGAYVEGQTVVSVTSASHMEEILREGIAERVVAPTRGNDASSRSHAVFSLTVTQTKIGQEQRVMRRLSRVHLIDLGGSERAGQHGASGTQLKEATAINHSLLCLSRVISGLATNSPHVPFRESVLTFLLQDALGGNSKTTLLATVSPASVHCDETLSTLRYATTAKCVENTPIANVRPATEVETIEALQANNALLRREVAELHGRLHRGSVSAVSSDDGSEDSPLLFASELDNMQRWKDMFLKDVSRSRSLLSELPVSPSSPS